MLKKYSIIYYTKIPLAYVLSVLSLLKNRNDEMKFSESSMFNFRTICESIMGHRKVNLEICEWFVGYMGKFVHGHM